MISNYMTSDDVTFEITGNDKFEIISKMVEFLQKRGKIDDYKEVLSAVISREKIRPTGLQYGIAIPHGKINKLEKVAMAVARLDNPVDFQSIDGKLCRHIAIIIAKREDGAPAHIAALKVVARPYLKEESINRLDAAKTPEEYFKLLVECGNE